MATPLKIKDGSGNIQEMTTSDENYIAYQMGLHLAGAGTTEPGSLNKAASGTSVGSYDNTFFNEPVGTHPSTSISTGTTTTNIYQTTGTAAETNSNIETPLQWVDAGGQTGFKTMPSAAVDAAVDRYLSTIFTGEYPGSYRIATTAPSSDWSIAINAAVTDTRTDGTSVPYHIYKRQTMTAPATKRPLYDRDGDGENIKAMSDDQIKWSFGQRAKTRMSSTSIGTFQLRNSSQGAPTDTGTWVAKGVALDTKQTTSQGNFQSTSTLNFNTTYTRGYENAFSTNYISTTDVDYQATKAINYTNTYEGSFANIQSENFDRAYDTAYTQDYITSYTTGYSGTYNQVYLGSYDNTFTTDYQATKAINYVGTYSGAFNASYTTGYDIAFSANYTTIYTQAYNTAYNLNVNYDNTFAASYVREYAINYNTDYVGTYDKSYDVDRIALYNQQYTGTRTYQGNLNYVSQDFATYTRNITYDRILPVSYEGPATNFTRNYEGGSSTTYTGRHFYNWGVTSIIWTGTTQSNDIWGTGDTAVGNMTFGIYNGQPEDDAGNRWDFYAYWDGIRDVGAGEAIAVIFPNTSAQYRVVRSVYYSPDAGDVIHNIPHSEWIQSVYQLDYRFSNSLRSSVYFQRTGFYIGFYQGEQGYNVITLANYVGDYLQAYYIGQGDVGFVGPDLNYVTVYNGPTFTVPNGGFFVSSFTNFNINYATVYTANYTSAYDGAYYEAGYDSTAQTFNTAYANTYDSGYNLVVDYLVDYLIDYDTNYTTDYTSTFSTNYVNTYEGAFDGSAYNTVYTGNYVTNYDTVFETSFAINYEGATFNTNYDSQYAIDYTSTYTSTYTGLYTSDYTGAFDAAYNTVYTGNYVNTYTGDYTATYDSVFEAGYIKEYIIDYIGDFSGLQIDATSETNETYTLYVRIA